jgi:hypothetical protein
MLAVFALIAIGPSEVKLPAGSMTPSAVVAGASVDIVYGDGKDGYFTTIEQKSRTRINSEAGTVHAGGERGPRIAMSGETVCCAWQGDYRSGPKVWFSRSDDGGKTFEPQRNLLQEPTPGVDHVSVAASGKTVAVFWIDGRGGEDDNAPTTAEVWYALSTDSGKTFSRERRIAANPPLRACACCRLDPHLFGTTANLYYRGGAGGMREIWVAKGDLAGNPWKTQTITGDKWELNGCPMDGPRMDGEYLAYFMEGYCFVRYAGQTLRLGPGKYPEVVALTDDACVTWQEGSTLHWRYVKGGESGTMPVGPSRAALLAPAGRAPIVIHG